jgi:hypothetical protein
MAFVFQFRASEAQAQSNYFTSIGCVNCHAAPVAATCNGCHSHGTHPTSAKSSLNVAGTTNKASYAPGETVTVTMTGGYRTGWFRATLFDTDGVTELARSSGNDSGMGNSATYPATLTAPAPTTQGTYTWVIAWYGNAYDKSGGFFGSGWTLDPDNQNTGTPNASHGWEKVNLPSFTVAAAVPSAPTVSSISPNSMVQGAMNSTLTINGTNLTGATVAFSGTGITTGMITSSSTSISVPVTVAATATTGARTLTVTTAGGSATSTFTVTAAPVPAPTIGSVTPNSLVQGAASQIVTIAGTNLTGATVSFSNAGVTGGTATISASSISLPVSVTAGAVVGAGTISVTTASGSASSTFTVTAAPVPAPTIGSVTPNSLVQGAVNQSVTISGTNLTGATVSFSNAGVTHGTAIVTATAINLPVSVTAGATVGTGTITVTTATGSAASAFTVTAAPIAAPTIGSVTPNSLVQGSSQTVTIAGTNLSAGAVSFSNAGVTGGTATVSASSISLPVTVAAGATVGAGTVTVTTAGGSASSAVTVTAIPVSAPVLTLSMLADGSYTNKVTLNISGTATDQGGIKSVTVNGTPVTVNPADGSFSTAITLVIGSNVVTIVATDTANLQTTQTRTIIYDPNAPVLTVASPADNSTTTQASIAVNGTVNESSTVTISENTGSPQTATMSGNSYNGSVNLVPGVNTITINATDLAGNTSTVKRTVTYNNSISALMLAVTSPDRDITTNKASMILKGTVTDTGGSKVKVKITMNGHTYTPVIVRGTFQQRLAFTLSTAEKIAAKKKSEDFIGQLYTITVTATDAAGNSSTVTRNVIYNPNTSGGDD